MNQSCLNFDGETFVPELDGKRISRQFDYVFDLMKDGKWRTLKQIQLALLKQGVFATEAGISARLRDFRKKRYGEHTVNRMRTGDPKSGKFTYQLLVKVKRNNG